jgi:methyltransferase OMS1, mitochondrial
LWAVSIFGGILGVYFVSFGVSFHNARQKNKELDLEQNADVAYRWRDEQRNFDHEVDNAETYMLMKAKRRRLINEAYGNVLEVSVGTGRNFELYDLRPYDEKEDQKYGRSRTRIVSNLTFNDQSEVMVDHAMSKYLAMELRRNEDERFQGNVRFVVGDAGVDGVIDRPSGGYDTVVQTFGICSMADPVGFLRKLGKLCRQPGEASTSKLPNEENDGKGGRILLLEHGRGDYTWLNNILDSVAKVHALNFGCWWNKDIQNVIEQSGLEIERIKRYHGGTTWEIVLRPKASSDS